MTQEALKLALEYIQAVPDDRYNAEHIDRDTLITAIKETLAQTQEPVKMVAYNCFCGRTMKFESVHGVVAPQRTWVGLTDEEITELRLKTLDAVATNHEVYRAIEAKLKEKNT